QVQGEPSRSVPAPDLHVVRIGVDHGQVEDVVGVEVRRQDGVRRQPDVDRGQVAEGPGAGTAHNRDGVVVRVGGGDVDVRVVVPVPDRDAERTGADGRA